MDMYDYMRHFFKRVAFITFLFLGACSGHDNGTGDEYLIRIGERVVTVADFRRAFEIAKTAYPYSSMQNPEDIKDTQLRLLNQMTEEMILLQRASELSIRVSDVEVKQAVDKIKSDYPDDVFEETLLEYAVSYKSWESGLKTRLLMEKLVEQELKDEIVITADEIAAFYKELYDDDPSQPGEMQNSGDIEEIIVKQLRRKKIELAYKTWIEKLRKQYTVDINREEWDKLLKSPG
jgi:parvulin-like peptidyl-prolyl isomerase